MNLINIKKTTFYKMIFVILTMILLVGCDNASVSCTDNCTYEGEFTCNGDSVLLCERESNGCLKTKKITNCADDEKTCFNGNCEMSCDKDCGENRFCVLMNEEETCECLEGFHHPEEGNGACVSSKQVPCDSQNPDNSTITDTVLVEVTWNDDSNDWNTPAKCAWTCNDEYHLVLDTKCEPDVKLEDCTEITPPGNATQTKEKVEVEWISSTENDYEDPANCEWKCNANYHKNEAGDACVEDSCGENNPCVRDETCNPNPTCVNGVCVPDYQDGDNCDDGNECTQSSSCKSGVCVGSRQISCTEHSTCNTGSGDCDCDADFHDESGSCVSDTKSVDCKNVSPLNASPNIIQVGVVWNTTTNSWSEPIDCSWTCNADYHTEDDATCVSDTKTVACSDITPPNHGHQETGMVSVTWDGTNWSTAADCNWACNTYYHTEDNATCVSDTKNVACTDITPPNNGYQVDRQVEISWDGTNWSTAADCNWVCDAYYHTEDDSTCVSDTKNVACTDITPPVDNAHQVDVQVEIYWNADTKDWTPAANCGWECDTGYEGNTCSECSDGYYPDGPELANCKLAECGTADDITKNTNNKDKNRAYEILLDQNNNWENDDLNTQKADNSNCDRENDYYKVNAVYGERLKVRIEFVDANGDLTLKLNDFNDHEVANSRTRDDFEEITYDIRSGKDGFYYIKIDNALNSYSMTVTKTCAPSFQDNDGNGTCEKSCSKQEECEAEFCDDSSGTAVCSCSDSITSNNGNTTWERALLISIRDWSATNLTTSMDVVPPATSCSAADDWYKIKANYGEELTVGIDFIHASGDLDLYLYYEDNLSYNYNDSVDSSAYGEDNELLSYNIPTNKNGFYYIWVEAYQNAQNVYDMEVLRDCATGFTYNSVLNRCLLDGCSVVTPNQSKRYIYCEVQKDWKESRDFCNSYGFYLATINGAAENNRISQGFGSNSAWIGLNDRDNEAYNNDTSSNWVWVYGTSSYKNWGENEPNNDSFGSYVDGGEDCVHMWGNGTWNDGDCDDGHYFVCEKDL